MGFHQAKHHTYQTTIHPGDYQRTQQLQLFSIVNY